jgi:hypothetical protein
MTYRDGVQTECKKIKFDHDEKTTSQTMTLENPVSIDVSWGGLIGATVTVLVTTLDDSVWLLPFVGTSSLNIKTRLLHAGIFTLTLLGLAFTCCLLAIALERGLSSVNKMDEETLEIKLELVAVVICWLLAGGFFLRKLHRRRQRRQQHTDNESSTNVTYGSVPQEEPTSKQNMEAQHADDEWDRLPTSPQPWTVVTLTTVGFLDEISYFPALVIGKVFSVLELCLGTLLAALLMLVIQAYLANFCKPLIAFLDNRVPLYGIIALFATLLTLHVIWDIVTL